MSVAHRLEKKAKMESGHACQNTPLRWGIFGTGKIAQDFVTAMQQSNSGIPVAVSSRSLESAQQFGELFNIPQEKCFDSIDPILNDVNVEAVYVSGIHPVHFEHAKACLLKKKPVLVEKPICVNAKETQELIRLARENKTLIMEAMWTRHFPLVKKIRQILESETLGKITQVSASFGFKVKEESPIQRLITKELGGGALLDVGIYAVSFCSMIFGGQFPKKIFALGQLHPTTGVDIQDSVLLQYGDAFATINCCLNAELAKEVIIVGTLGRLRLCEPFWCPTAMELTIGDSIQTFNDPIPKSDKHYNFRHSSGLTYQLDHFMHLVREGVKESPRLGFDEMVTIMKILDEIRKQIGLTYPKHD